MSNTCAASQGTLARDDRAQLAKAKAKTLIVGLRTYAIASGHHQRLVVRLNARGRRLLNGQGTLLATRVQAPR